MGVWQSKTAWTLVGFLLTPEGVMKYTHGTYQFFDKVETSPTLHAIYALIKIKGPIILISCLL